MSELADPDLGCCGKSQETSLDLKRRGNLCFRSRSFDDALRFYSKALRVAPLHSLDGDKSLLASLFLNRANALHVSDLSLSFFPLRFHHWVNLLPLMSLESGACRRELAGLSSCSSDWSLLRKGFNLFWFQLFASVFNDIFVQAWYRRGKLNTLLGNYKYAFRDITVSLSLESSPAGKKQLQSELLPFPDYLNHQTSDNTRSYDAVGEVSLHC